MNDARKRCLVGRRMYEKLRHMNNVTDRGLLVGSAERREWMRLFKEMSDLLYVMRGLDHADRVAEKEADNAPV